MLSSGLIWYAQKFRQQGCNKSSCAPWGQKYNSNPHGGSNISNATISLVVSARQRGAGVEKNGNEVRNSKRTQLQFEDGQNRYHADHERGPLRIASSPPSRGLMKRIERWVVDSLFFNGQSVELMLDSKTRKKTPENWEFIISLENILDKKWELTKCKIDGR